MKQYLLDRIKEKREIWYTVKVRRDKTVGHLLHYDSLHHGRQASVENRPLIILVFDTILCNKNICLICIQNQKSHNLQNKKRMFNSLQCESNL